MPRYYKVVASVGLFAGLYNIIENDRIRNAVFDMNVMGGAGKVVQRAINSFSDANLKIDGVIGKETIKAINSIPDTKIEEFMSTINSERIDYLRNTRNWETAIYLNLIEYVCCAQKKPLYNAIVD